MALEAVTLDDLQWNDMVTSIRRRIPADSDGLWTLHAAVDPGITLLELFAWMLEQRVYWMDQVPDSLVRASLALLGESPRAAESAAAVLVFSPQPFTALAAQSEMRLANRVPSLIFSVQDAVTLLPLEQRNKTSYRLGLFINGTDRTSDLEHSRVMNLFPASGGEAEVKIVLWFTAPLPASPPSEPFSLFFELRTPNAILPEWSPSATSNVPPPAALTWWYRSSVSGRLVQFNAGSVIDGTGGLRRSGVVRLAIPADWASEAGGGATTPFAIWIRTDAEDFASPPRIERLIPNVAIVQHQRLTRVHQIKRMWQALPGNIIDLSELPEGEIEKDAPPIPGSVALRLRERDLQWHEWAETFDFTFHGPGDRVFLVDRDYSAIRFGDGLAGRLPVLDQASAMNIELQYQVGAGTAGILGANLGWENADDPTLAAINVTSTSGGAEPESIESARDRAAASLKEITRAITRDDYEELALTTPGVAVKRAHAAVGYHPLYPCTAVPGAVTVFIVPEVPRDETDEDFAESAFVAAPVPDAGMLGAVRARLDAARLITSEVFVLAPRYRPAALTIEIQADPADPISLRQQITDRMRSFLDPLTGGDDNDGWPFGEPLRPSVLLREAQDELGDSGEVELVSISLLDSSAAAESCSDVAVGPHDLVFAEKITVKLKRGAASQGGLR